MLSVHRNRWVSLRSTPSYEHRSTIPPAASAGSSGIHGRFCRIRSSGNAKGTRRCLLRTVSRMGGAQRYPCCPCIGIDGYRYAPRHPTNTARPSPRQRAPDRAASTADSAGSGAPEMEKAPESASCVRSVGWVERSDTHAVRASESMGIATLHAILRTPLDHTAGSGSRSERHPRQVLPDQRATALARAWCSFL